MVLPAPDSVSAVLQYVEVCQQILKIRLDARRGLVEYCGGGAREGFVVRVVEGIDAELDQAGRQQVKEFF